MNRTEIKIVFSCVVLMIVVWSVGIALTFAFMPSSPMPYDDTDNPPNRSGMILYTDSLTGCQYLSVSRSGGITPRMGANGKQICGEVSQ